MSLEAADVPLGRGFFVVGQLRAALHPNLVVLDRATAPPTVIGPADDAVLGDRVPRVRSLAGELGAEHRVGRWVIGARLGAKTVGYDVGRPYGAGYRALVSIAARFAD